MLCLRQQCIIQQLWMASVLRLTSLKKILMFAIISEDIMKADMILYENMYLFKFFCTYFQLSKLYSAWHFFILYNFFSKFISANGNAHEGRAVRGGEAVQIFPEFPLSHSNTCSGSHFKPFSCSRALCGSTQWLNKSPESNRTSLSTSFFLPSPEIQAWEHKALFTERACVKIPLLAGHFRSLRVIK